MADVAAAVAVAIVVVGKRGTVGVALGALGEAVWSAVAAYIVGISTCLSSWNCRVGLLGPGWTAIRQSSWRALWNRAVEGREERLSSSRSAAFSVVTPKLLVCWAWALLASSGL